MLKMTFKIKKTAKAAGAAALSVMMASAMFAGVTASAATAVPIDPNTIPGTDGTLVYTVGGWFYTKDCYYVNGDYYPKGTVNFTDIYREYSDGTVYIEGNVYRMKDCVYYNGRYYSRDAAPIATTNPSNPYYYYYNGYYNGNYYAEYSDYVIIGGYYYDKDDCNYDTTTKRYYPKTGVKGYYYYGSNEYVEGSSYVIIRGYVYAKSDCTYSNGRYQPISTAKYITYVPTGAYYYNGQVYNSYADYLSSLRYYNGYYFTSNTSSSVSESDPFIYGNSKKKGWNAIMNTIYASKKGATVKIDMNKTAVISKKFLNAVQGKNINLQFVMSNGAVWSFNGRDIDKDSVRAVNVSVKYNTNKVPAILKQKASIGQGSYCEITVGTDAGYMGFYGSLTTKFNKNKAGKVAKIYRYDAGRNVLILVDTAVINADGSAAFDLVNTGTYAITISK